MSSKSKSQRPGPKKLSLAVALERLDGFPTFYTAAAEGTIKCGGEEIDWMIGAAINGGAAFFRVGDAWYALPTHKLAEVAIPLIAEAALGKEVSSA